MNATGSEFKTLAAGLSAGLSEIGFTPGEQALMFGDLPVDNPGAYKRKREPNKLSDNLNRLIARHKVRLPDVSRATTVASSTLYDWLNDPDVSQVADYRIELVAKFFNVDPGQLLFGEV